MIRTTRWPRSWNSRSLRRTTVCPRWMSGAVGSMPNLNRNGRPSREAPASFSSSAPSGSESTASRASQAAVSAAERPEDGIRANARLRALPRPEQASASSSKPPSFRPCWRPVELHGPSRRRPHPVSRDDRPNILTAAATGGSVPLAGEIAPPVPFPRRGLRWRRPPSGRPRIKKLRLLLCLLGLGLIALVSTVFGMMMAVASDLPALENRQDLKSARNSVVTDDKGRRLGILTSRENRILVTPNQIPA